MRLPSFSLSNGGGILHSLLVSLAASIGLIEVVAGSSHSWISCWTVFSSDEVEVDSASGFEVRSF